MFNEKSNLLSFPTRRSSDLGVADHNEDIMMKYLEGEEIEEAELKNAIREATLSVDFFPVFAASAFKNKGDRKSTRLNSSHVAISYAVFCLKKKIKKIKKYLI